MSTHNIHFYDKIRTFLYNIPKDVLFRAIRRIPRDSKNEFELVTVNEQSVFESLRFYGTWGSRYTIFSP